MARNRNIARPRPRARSALAALGLFSVAVAAAGSAVSAAVTPGGADVRLDATSGGRIEAGVAFDRIVTVTNAGDGAARDLHVVVRLPAGLRFATVLPIFNRGTCTVVSVGPAGGQRVLADCSRRSLAAGAAATLRMPLVTVPGIRCGPLVSTAEVSAHNEPSGAVDEGNRTTIADELACDATPGPDLAVSSDVDRIGPLPGRARLAYALEVANTGDAPAEDVRVSATLPAGVAVAGAPRGPATCAVASSDASDREPRWSVSCRIDRLDPDGRAAIQVPARVGPAPRCVDARLVTTVRSVDEPRALRGSENRSAATVSLACRPRLRLTVRAPAAAHPGATIPVKVHVRNASAASIGDARVAVGGCGSRIALIEDADGDRVLGPRERWTFRCRRSVGWRADPATVPTVVRARDAARQVAVARATRRVDVWHPSLSLEDIGGPATARVGTRTTLLATVRNTGDAPLVGIEVAIPRLGPAATVDALAPGAARVVELRVTVPRRAGPLGGLSATGVDRLGRAVEVTEAVPLTVVADADSGAIGDGDPAPGGSTSSAFTGGDLVGAVALGTGLSLVGLASLLAARRLTRRA